MYTYVYVFVCVCVCVCVSVIHPHDVTAWTLPDTINSY